MTDEKIKKLWFEDGKICIETDKGNVLSKPLEVFPALFFANPQQRDAYRICFNSQAIRWEEIDEDIHIMDFYEVDTVNYDNEVNQILSNCPCLDIKAFANSIGMHWTKLARFRYGVWTPSAETLQKIRDGIKTIAKEMSAAVL